MISYSMSQCGRVPESDRQNEANLYVSQSVGSAKEPSLSNSQGSHRKRYGLEVRIDAQKKSRRIQRGMNFG